MGERSGSSETGDWFWRCVVVPAHILRFRFEIRRFHFHVHDLLDRIKYRQRDDATVSVRMMCRNSKIEKRISIFYSIITTEIYQTKYQECRQKQSRESESKRFPQKQQQEQKHLPKYLDGSVGLTNNEDQSSSFPFISVVVVVVVVYTALSGWNGSVTKRRNAALCFVLCAFY